MIDVLVVGLLDQVEGHYKEFARRWLTILDFLGEHIRVKGYVTIRSFRPQTFGCTGIPFYNCFEDDLNLQKILPLVSKRVRVRLSILRRLKVASSILGDVPCDIVLFLGMDSIAFSFLNKRYFCGTKLIPILHNLVPLERGNYFKRIIFKASLSRLLDRSYKVIVLEEAVRKIIVKELGPRAYKKVIVIHEPRWPKYKPIVGQQKLMPRKFLAIGTVSPGKGFDTAIEAFRKLLPEFQNAQLTIAGKAVDDAYSTRLRDLLSTVNSTRIVWLNRYLSSQEYTNLIAQSDCVLLPYLSSTGARSSGVLLDALELAKPVIMSDIPAFQDIHNEYGVGLLFNAGDIDDLTTKIRQALEAGFSPAQLQAIERVMESYSPQTAAYRLMQALELG